MEHNAIKESPQEDYNKSDVRLMLLNIKCTIVDNDPQVDNNEVLWDHVYKSETSAATLDERKKGNPTSNVVN